MASENKHLTPVWIVYIDGKRLDTKHEGALQRIAITDRLNGIGTFSLLFDQSAEKLLDAGTISLESTVSIHLGYKDDVEEVFVGEITKCESKFVEYGNEQLEVSGCNVLYKLQHGHQFVSYQEQSVSDAIKSVVESYSLTMETDTFGTVRPFSTEFAMSDYDFILQAAKMYGKQVYAYDSKIYVKDEITVKTDEIIFEWGKSLISCQCSECVQDTVSECTYVGWDKLKGSAVTGTATISDVPLKIGGDKNWTNVSKGGGGKWKSTVVTSDICDSEDAKNRALGDMQYNSFQFGTASGTAEGTYKLFPGMRVTLKYIGEKMSGEYMADVVMHNFDYNSGYTTSFILKRNMQS